MVRSLVTMEHAGDLIGRYQLIRQLGSGGMGTVWLATRADGSFDREVAVKLLHGALGDAELEGRFQREREILGALDAPGIARILDAGVTEDGRPYHVMEAVIGRALNVYCAGLESGTAATLDETLDLLIQAARALDHAHQRHVLHRDVKPSNLLVTDAGEVKLIDFGIARWTERALGRDAFVTQGPLSYLTPEFASPEQAAGEPIARYSDIYSLARVAQEVLPGDASDLQSGSDLAEVLGTALRRIPEERYATAAHLADDLENVRQGRPVSVLKTSRIRRIQRTLWRNRDLALAGAIAAALVVGGLALAGSHRRRAGSELDAAEQSHAMVLERSARVDEQLARLAQTGSNILRGESAPLRVKRDVVHSLSEVALAHSSPALSLEAARSCLDLVETWSTSEDEELRGLVDETLARAIELLESPSQAAPSSPDALERAQLRKRAKNLEVR